MFQACIAGEHFKRFFNRSVQRQRFAAGDYLAVRVAGHSRDRICFFIHTIAKTAHIVAGKASGKADADAVTHLQLAVDTDEFGGCGVTEDGFFDVLTHVKSS